MRQLGQRPNPNQRSELAQALASCRGAFVATALMSGMSNILMLTGAIFMLEIYDRVLPSRSIPTLVALVILAAGLFTAQGLLDLIRGRVLVRIGARLDETAQRAGLRDDRAAAAEVPETATTACSRCAISTTCDRSCRGRGRPHCSICHGCRSISRSVSHFIR